MRLRPPALLFGLGLALVSFSPRPFGQPPRPKEPVDHVAADPQELAIQEQDLLKAVRAEDAPAALDFFRKRTPSAAQRRELRELIHNLADESFEVRHQASVQLTASGPVAAAFLRRAVRNHDLEVAKQAETCLTQSRHDHRAPLLRSAVQLIIRQRPTDTIAILFGYLPFAEDEAIAADIREAMVALTLKDGKAVRVILDALASPEAELRAEAAAILAHANLADQRAAVRRLLNDADAFVRLSVARALVETKDKDAIPVLIDLLGDLIGDDRWDIEDLLDRIAAENAPALPRSDAPDIRRQRRDAWRGWWKAHGATVDLARLAAPPRLTDRTLLVHMDLTFSEGHIIEIGLDGKTRRVIDSLKGPIAAERLGDDRVLIAEYAGKRVLESDFDGKVLWEHKLPSPPVAVQRLANGNTFIACRNRLLEIDPDGKEIVTRQRPVRDVLGARRHPDGSIAIITDDGRCRWLDSAGRETSSFPVGGPLVMGVAIDVLPNKRVLVPRFADGLVTEYDRTGLVLWQATIAGGASAERLPNGHTLVGCTTQPALVVELDRTGRIVWQHQAKPALTQATRR